MLYKAGRVILLLSSVLVVSTIGAKAQTESTLDKIKRTGVFTAGVRADFPPIGSVDDRGEPIGFGPELSKIFADKLGVKVKYVFVSSPNRIPLIQNGGIDADVGLTTPSKSRNEIIDFTTPYIWDSIVLLVKKGAPKNVKDYGPPKKISLTQGSAVIDYIKEKVPDAQLVLFQESAHAAGAMIEGKVDAYATDGYAARAIAKDHPDFEVGDIVTLDPMSIGVHQNDSKWLNWLNFTMQEMWQKGEYQTLFVKHFGEKPTWQIWSHYRLQPGIGRP
jgi:putative glutamine transport system substrate-binding protein